MLYYKAIENLILLEDYMGTEQACNHFNIQKSNSNYPLGEKLLRAEHIVYN